MSVRRPAVAGSFYPEDAKQLRSVIHQYLELAEEKELDGRLRALVEPHAGYVYSGPVAAFGYKLLAKAEGIRKIILIGPSHYGLFPGAAEDGNDIWQTPLGDVRAMSLKNALRGAARRLVEPYPQAHAMEHCLEVQVPFLQEVMGGGFEIYPLLTGDMDPKELGDAIAEILDDETLVIASSDLSHYLPYDDALMIDRKANESVPALDIKRFEKDGDACGKMGILVLMHIAKRKGWKGVLLDYRNSGDTAGPKSSVVGYGCYAFYSD